MFGRRGQPGTEQNLCTGSDLLVHSAVHHKSAVQERGASFLAFVEEAVTVDLSQK